jgi:hypothetical protein
MNWKRRARQAAALVLLPPLFLSSIATGILILAVRALTAGMTDR